MKKKVREFDEIDPLDLIKELRRIKRYSEKAIKLLKPLSFYKGKARILHKPLTDEEKVLILEHSNFHNPERDVEIYQRYAVDRESLKMIAEQYDFISVTAVSVIVIKIRKFLEKETDGIKERKEHIIYKPLTTEEEAIILKQSRFWNPKRDVEIYKKYTISNKNMKKIAEDYYELTSPQAVQHVIIKIRKFLDNKTSKNLKN